MNMKEERKGAAKRWLNIALVVVMLFGIAKPALASTTFQSGETRVNLHYGAGSHVTVSNVRYRSTNPVESYPFAMSQAWFGAHDVSRVSIRSYETVTRDRDGWTSIWVHPSNLRATVRVNGPTTITYNIPPSRDGARQVQVFFDGNSVNSESITASLKYDEWGQFVTGTTISLTQPGAYILEFLYGADWPEYLMVIVEGDAPTNGLSLKFYSRLKNDVHGVYVNFTPELLRQDARVYNHDLAIVSAILSESAYNETRARENLRRLGFTDSSIHQNYDIRHIHDVAYTFAYHPDANTVAVVIRGTPGCPVEWAGNISELFLPGFALGATAIRLQLNQYLDSRGLDSNNLRFWITGHSRGAAVANHLGYMLTAPSPIGGISQERVFVYTFGGPRFIPMLQPSVTRNNIFNFLNRDDPLAFLIPGHIMHGRTTFFAVTGDAAYRFRYFTNRTYESRSTHGALVTGIFAAHGVVSPHHSHTPEAYLAFLLAVTRPETISFRARAVVVRSPVDIDVFDSEGMLVGRVVDGIIDTSFEERIVIWINDENYDGKHFFLPQEGEFTFKMVGTDDGTMSVTTVYVDVETWEVQNQRDFYDIALYSGKELTTTVGEGVAVAESRIFVIENGVPVREVLENGTEVPYLPFTDVRPSDWFFPYVHFVFENNIMLGTSSTTFAPNANFTRAMTVAALYRMVHGGTAIEVPYAQIRQIFSDVPTDTWFSHYVAWAYDNDIVVGVGDNRFAPNDNVTREQFATLVYRLADSRGQVQSAHESPQWSNFTDQQQVSPWAESPLRWANYHGTITGRTFTTIVPDGNATRAEAAAILMRYMQMVED